MSNRFLVMEGADLTKRTILTRLPNKVIFKAVLQTVDGKNRNGRIYTKRALEEALKFKMETLINPRGFVGELDHPMLANYGDEQAVELRLSTVLWERCSHVITKFWFENNELWGIVESTLFGLGDQVVKIIKDDVPLGFSLRAIGQGNRVGDHVVVDHIDYLVSYDAVSTPSHMEAHFRNLSEEKFYNIQESLKIGNLSSGVKSENFEKILFETLNKWC
ncbi:hypothetical protein M0R36_10125 [bacterium]|jgi:hypothetical protein|nr:hypothetical protein [bacterium]